MLCQHLIMNPNIGLLCWLQKSGQDDLVLLQLKGLSVTQLGPGCWEGTRAGVYGQSLGRRLSISQGKHATVFQALACAHEIQTNATSGKYISICPDSQVALKAPQAAKTSPLVQQRQGRWMTFPPGILWGCFRVPGHSVVLGNENANKLARVCLV